MRWTGFRLRGTPPRFSRIQSKIFGIARSFGESQNDELVKYTERNSVNELSSRTNSYQIENSWWWRANKDERTPHVGDSSSAPVVPPFFKGPLTTVRQNKNRPFSNLPYAESLELHGGRVWMDADAEFYPSPAAFGFIEFPLLMWIAESVHPRLVSNCQMSKWRCAKPHGFVFAGAAAGCKKMGHLSIYWALG